jgi:hypothetical protein
MAGRIRTPGSLQSGFGLAKSEYPFIAPERCLGELEELGLDSPVLLHDNAARVLGLPALPSGLDQCARDRHLMCDRSAPLDARHPYVCFQAAVQGFAP